MSNKIGDEKVANIEELIQEYKTYNDLDGIQDLSIYVNALEHILAEREQKDKRIQELEEECKRKDMFLQMSQEVIENSIPTQRVENKIEELKEVRKIALERKMMSSVESFEIAIGHLQELLEGRNENGF